MISLTLVGRPKALHIMVQLMRVSGIHESRWGLFPDGGQDKPHDGSWLGVRSALFDSFEQGTM